MRTYVTGIDKSKCESKSDSGFSAIKISIAMYQTIAAGLWPVSTCLINYLENLPGNSGQSNTYQTEMRIRVIAKDYRSRIVCLGSQGVLTQRMVLRLG
jgi:hypothetical protein